MIALIQRVSRARVIVDGEVVGEIAGGLCALVCAERDDGLTQVNRLVDRVLTYRVFPDERGKMNVSLRDQQGGLLIVPQFTLAADTRSGTRPSFTPAADPVRGLELYRAFVACARQQHPLVAEGRFGATMTVELANEGPVTFWLRQAPGGEA